jgi:hypothetical protein
MTPARLAAPLVLSALALTLPACGRPFDVRTPTGFAELEERRSGYDYRATTPDGVVTSVRAVEIDERGGNLDFWVQAVTLRVRDAGGYALLGSEDVTARDGTRGKRLRFGHDEGGKPYGYVVTLFRTRARLFVLEAGGPRALMDRFAGPLDWQVRNFRPG